MGVPFLKSMASATAARPMLQFFSSKHINSSACSHQQDMRRMKELISDTFEGKLVLIIAVSRGPVHEYQNTLHMSKSCFSYNQLNLIAEIMS